MIVSLIVAMGPKREIGFENKLLWHNSEDLKNFKKVTTGKSILMGRKTFESIGKPLPKRQNIVLTNKMNLTIEGVSVISDPMMAFDLALSFDDSDESELIIIGGAEIYKLYLPYVQKIYLSEIDYQGPADTFFPELDLKEWHTSQTQDFEHFKYKILERI